MRANGAPVGGLYNASDIQCCALNSLVHALARLSLKPSDIPRPTCGHADGPNGEDADRLQLLQRQSGEDLDPLLWAPLRSRMARSGCRNCAECLCVVAWMVGLHPGLGHVMLDDSVALPPASWTAQFPSFHRGMGGSGP